MSELDEEFESIVGSTSLVPKRGLLIWIFFEAIGLQKIWQIDEEEMRGRDCLTGRAKNLKTKNFPIAKNQTIEKKYGLQI